jgi:hypothetical protein
MDLKVVRIGGVDWTELVQDGDSDGSFLILQRIFGLRYKRQILDELSNWQLLKKYSLPCSYYVG